MEEEPFCTTKDRGKDFEQSFTVHLRFHSLSEYPPATHLTWGELADTVRGAFVREASRAIVKQLKCAAPVVA